MGTDSSALAAYALGGVNEVEGWLHNGAITSTVLLSRAQRDRWIRGDVGEIGIHHGKYFLLLCQMCQGDEVAIGIDVFSDQHLNTDRSGNGDRLIFESNIDKILKDRNHLTILQADSLSLTGETLRKYTNKKFRMFSIDGGHTVAHVLNDLTLLEETLHHHGIVVVDDFFNPGWPGVSEGMFCYWAAGGCLRPFAYGDGKLFLSHRHTQKEYYDLSLATLHPLASRSKKVELCGDECLYLLMPPPSAIMTADGRLMSSLWDFSVNGKGSALLGGGWSKPDRHGTWTVGRRANLRIPLQTGHRADGTSILMRISGYPFIPPERGKQGVLVRLDGHDLIRNEWTRNGLATIDVKVPGSLVLTGQNKLELISDFAAAPSGSGISADTRLLGFHLTRIVTFDAPEISSADNPRAPEIPAPKLLTNHERLTSHSLIGVDT